jgi:peptide-methionine (S)-S-oxide reductase
MSRKLTWFAVLATVVVVAVVLWARGTWPISESSADHDRQVRARTSSGPVPAHAQKATFGGGCFWCVEAMFQQLRGVHSVVSGYSGGVVKDPTYEQVCSGTTGHAEVIQITYDPDMISFAELLEVFWKSHDPTTPNRQGNDIGPQYRSVIFYHSPEQKELAEQYKRKLDASGAFEAPIVTEIAPFSAFYPAEAYHQNYFVDHPRQSYCTFVIRPKLEKFEKVFKDKLKDAGPP